ncbi:hypothetical protein MVEN_01453700 [Mycena venus]|uniref:Uncharacterized protein n=1 Tax=Mycena venus TaxID=2733690 RepID=A0A8H7CT19_9AGAR|nr:hypothetical protein MVEN_01453700 [Mycena venus]
MVSLDMTHQQQRAVVLLQGNLALVIDMDMSTNPCIWYPAQKPLQWHHPLSSMCLSHSQGNLVASRCRCCFLDPWIDTFQFRTTCSGRQFSEWETVSSQTFNIASAIAHSLELNAGHTEDLAELDSGPPATAIATTESHATVNWVLSSERPPATDRKSRDKLRSRNKHDAQHVTVKLKTDILLDARPHHPRHLLKAGSPIKTLFWMSKVRVAATGWIGIRDFGVCNDEKETEQAEHGPSPTYMLEDFFGPQANIEGFTHVPCLGPQT